MFFPLIFLLFTIAIISGCTQQASPFTSLEDSEQPDYTEPEEPGELINDSSPPAPLQSAWVVLADDTALNGDRVAVTSVIAGEDAWLTIHADDNGKPGAVLGYVLVSAGPSENKEVILSQGATATLWAMIHYDRGQAGVYEFPGEDVPVKNAEGDIVMDSFSVILPGEGPDKENIVEMSSGFSPQTLTIQAGQSVIFKNIDTRAIWPASDPHPVHSDYPEPGGCISSTFDACKGIEPGKSWEFTFTEKGTWTYHDHLGPGMKGTIVVE